MLTPKQIVWSKTLWVLLGTIVICALQKFWMIFPDDVFHSLILFLLGAIGAARVWNSTEKL